MGEPGKQREMKFKTTILSAMTITLCVGCPPPPNPPPQPDGDAGAVEDLDADVAPATCSNWCKRASVLNCSAARPTRGGATCVDVCNNVQTGPVKWNLRCRISAKTCAAADVCPPQ